MVVESELNIIFFFFQELIGVDNNTKDYDLYSMTYWLFKICKTDVRIHIYEE